MKQKPLKLWNGRWFPAGSQHVGHAYMCAHSRAHAKRIIIDVLGYEPRGLDGEIRNYWHEGCWGNTMRGIAPSVGLWIAKSHLDKPERVYPKERL